MKKIISILIISTSLFFSTLNNALALEENYREGSIESLLNLTYGPEISKLDTILINTMNFKSAKMLELQQTMLKYDSNLKEIIKEKYMNDELNYYQMNGIVTEYDFFVYNLNKYLERNRKIEKYSYLKKDPDVKKIINDSYQEMRSHINKLKYLVYEEN